MKNNQEKLSERVLAFLEANTEPDYMDILNTSEIAKALHLKTEDVFDVLVKLSNDEKIFYFPPVNQNNFGGADWSKVGTIDGKKVECSMRHYDN